MTVADWTSIGGWFASAIVVYLCAVLLFTRPTYEADDSRNRQNMLNLVILFGWIPAGILVLTVGHLVGFHSAS